jgi:hypothetical protein
LKRTGILLGCSLICGAFGVIIPLLVDRDVGGAMASTLLGIMGLIVGPIIGLIIIRKLDLVS